MSFPMNQPQYQPNPSPKRLQRSMVDKYIAGVCGGIAEYAGLDPALVRIGIVLIGLVTAFVPLIILYVVAWIVIPPEF
ncbi:PspC domain-containing protein [Corynebacterium sp. NML140438]|uniref:PspC domain-containing protein n=1 Tax=Corynebacterium sp. NML140438 TaxID=1906334 RepID=UPI000AE47E59|nr:PspC domain-containing protein [Corynebacterium sp. NML140438]